MWIYFVVVFLPGLSERIFSKYWHDLFEFLSYICSSVKTDERKPHHLFEIEWVEGLLTESETSWIMYHFRKHATEPDK
jgi:hypothetical protein